MDFFYGVVALLAFVVLILTALTAWMYVQQSRIMQAISALTAAISAPPPSFFESAKEFPIEEHYEPVETVKEHEEEVVDDRVSVHEEDDHEDEESEEHDQEQEHEDDLGGKTVAQLREILTTKGIPYNKSDKKPILLNLLKVAS
jgi:zinc transporter ZupT